MSLLSTIPRKFSLLGATLNSMIRINTWCVDNGYTIIAIGQMDATNEIYEVRAINGENEIVDMIFHVNATEVLLEGSVHPHTAPV